MQLTQAEQTFIARMVPHIEAGKTFEEAARAVLADDERLWLTTTAKTDEGQAIRNTLCANVYSRIRAA